VTIVTDYSEIHIKFTPIAISPGRLMDFDWMENTILLHCLNTEERKLLSATFDVVEFEVGDNIVTQDQQGGTLFIMRSGTAAITRSDKERKIYVGNVISGGVIGEMSFFRDEPVAATVMVHDMCRTYQLSREGYIKLLVANQQLVQSLFTYIVTHMANALDISNHQLASILKSTNQNK